MTISFSVPGVPVQGGSKKAFPYRKQGKLRIAITDVTGDRGKHWRAKTALAGAKAMQEAGLDAPIRTAILFGVTFYMPRPKAHYGSGKNQCIVKNSAPLHMIFMPDLDKLVRSTQDALSGVVWEDDRLIIDVNAKKFYAQKNPGAVINVTVL